MAILDDLLNRWKEKTPEEKIDLTQPAPPVVSPVSKIINSDWQNTASGGKRTDGTPLVDGKNLQQSWENTNTSLPTATRSSPTVKRKTASLKHVSIGRASTLKYLPKTYIL